MPEMGSMSIRVPRQLRELVAEASREIESSLVDFVVAAASQAADGVANRGKNLKLLPDWFVPDERDRKMQTYKIAKEKLELTQVAARRMMLPHTRFVLWAVTLAALNAVGRAGVKRVNRRVNKELRAEAA